MMGAEVTTRPNRPLFTAAQWQELEHQALIYKYMVSGVPIPHELIFSIRRSLDLSSLNSRLIPHQPIGWGCLQVGYGRKADPEPGRCRRTDGKKWRCSREAYPDSKYCEKHMHRGRNRSRKSVETSTTTTTTSSTTCFSSADNILNMNQSYPKFSNAYHRNSPYTSSSSASSSKLLDQNKGSQISVFGSGISSQTADKDFRYLQGVRESSDERCFFPEASGIRGGLQDWSYQPLTMSSTTSSYNMNYSSAAQQHCFVMGTDMFNPARSSMNKPQKEVEEDAVADDNPKGEDKESKKPIHHFFGDDWPPVKNTSDSWLDLASNTSLHTGSQKS